MEIIKIICFGFLGMLLYAVSQVWSKIKQEGFNPNKFFNENKRFWIVGIAFLILIAITVMFVPDIDSVISMLGFNIQQTPAGWVLLGIAIASGTDTTKVSGQKTLNKSI